MSIQFYVQSNSLPHNEFRFLVLRLTRLSPWSLAICFGNDVSKESEWFFYWTRWAMCSSSMHTFIKNNEHSKMYNVH